MKATIPTPIATTSSTVVTTRTVRLLCVSASCPAYPENSRNGNAKTAVTQGRWPLAVPVAPAAARATIEMTSRQTLSLNAPRNCVQRNAWKPRWPSTCV